MAWLSIRPEHLQLEAQRLDCLYWQRTLDKHPTAKEKFPRKTDRIIGNDLFRMLYAWEPTLQDNPSDIALSTWIDKRLDTPAVKELRRRTMGNQSVSAFSAIKMHQELTRKRESNFKAIGEVRNYAEAIKSKDNGAEEWKDSKEKIGQIQQMMADQIEKESSLADADSEAIQSADSASQSNGRTENAQIESAAQNVLDDLNGIEELVKITSSSKEFSLDGNENRYLDYGLDENLMSSIRSQTDFRKIMEAVGRLRILAGEIKSKKPLPTPTPVSVTTGNSIPDLVPSELAYLDDPDLEELFLLRFVDSALQQYDRRKREKIGRGPIVCLLDVSGSMNGIPMQNAKALCLTMMHTAIEQGRECVLVPFASYAGEPEYFTDLDSILSLINIRGRNYNGLGGGTNFDHPLSKALEIVKDKMPKADVILLTDGYSRVSEHVIEAVEKAKEDSEVRFIGINFAGQWQDSMEELLNAGVTVDNEGKFELAWAGEVLNLVV